MWERSHNGTCQQKKRPTWPIVMWVEVKGTAKPWRRTKSKKEVRTIKWCELNQGEGEDDLAVLLHDRNLIELEYIFIDRCHPSALVPDPKIASILVKGKSQLWLNEPDGRNTGSYLLWALSANASLGFLCQRPHTHLSSFRIPEGKVRSNDT